MFKWCLKIKHLMILLNIGPGEIPGYFVFEGNPALFQAQRYCGILSEIRQFLEETKVGTVKKIMWELTTSRSRDYLHPLPFC